MIEQASERFVITFWRQIKTIRHLLNNRCLSRSLLLLIGRSVLFPLGCRKHILHFEWKRNCFKLSHLPQMKFLFIRNDLFMRCLRLEINKHRFSFSFVSFSFIQTLTRTHLCTLRICEFCTAKIRIKFKLRFSDDHNSIEALHVMEWNQVTHYRI